MITITCMFTRTSSAAGCWKGQLIRVCGCGNMPSTGAAYHLIRMWYSVLCFILLATTSVSEMKQDSDSTNTVLKTAHVPNEYTQDMKTGSTLGLPGVLGQQRLKQYIAKFHSGVFAAIQSGVCGSQSGSQLVTMTTGEQFCCQLRQNTHMVQGELLTYHLARLLHLDNRVPVTVATQIQYTNNRLQVIRSAIPNEARWSLGAMLVCSVFVQNLEEVALPVEMREMVHQYFPKMSKQGEMEFKASNFPWFNEATSDPLWTQWVELVVLDYLTGNTDRLVNLLTSYHYNSDIVDAPVHNLAQSPSGDLVLFDHDRSFWIGYHFAGNDKQMKMYQEFFLMHMCTFPVKLLTTLGQICKQPEKFGDTLIKSLQMLDVKSFELVYPISHNVVEKLQERVGHLCDHITQTCKLSIVEVH